VASTVFWRIWVLFYYRQQAGGVERQKKVEWIRQFWKSPRMDEAWYAYDVQSSEWPNPILIRLGQLASSTQQSFLPTLCVRRRELKHWSAVTRDARQGKSRGLMTSLGFVECAIKCAMYGKYASPTSTNQTTKTHHPSSIHHPVEDT
jgi:hypothetical protein